MFAKIKKANEIKQTAVLYDNLVDAGKLKEDEYKQFLRSTKSKYWDKTERAKWKFIKSQNADFWDKLNTYAYSPIDLANQIYERTMDNLPMASATYLLTGIPVTKGTVVCAGSDIAGREIIANFNNKIKTCYTLTASDILAFIVEHAKYKQEPLAMIGIWKEEHRPDMKRWVMAICHDVGHGWADQYFTSYYDATYNEIIKSETEEDGE